MSEPFSGTAAGALGWKLLGGLVGIAAIGAGLVSVVVMCIMTPRSPREWAVGLICTVVSSVCGGAAAIQHLGLQSWAYSPFGLVGMIGLVFTCGLPGWALVRWMFNYIEKNRDRDLGEVVRDVREVL